MVSHPATLALRFRLRRDYGGRIAGAATTRATAPRCTSIRLVPAFLLLLLAATLPLSAAEAAFVHVWPGWRDAESFERISEFFGGQENTGRDQVLRTQAEPRDGFYFLVRVRPGSALPGARFELSVIRPDAPEPKVFTFPADVPARENVFHLGLTGAAWPGGRKASPLAWKLTLRAADGRVIAEEKSFLWEKPAK